MENQDRGKNLMSNVSFGKSTTKSTIKTSQLNEGRSSTRWDDFSSLKFIELCEEEIGKGNRPNSHFNINGWKNIGKRFNEMTGKNYTYKQLRNHWDAMKKDWILFKKLMQKETGVGWNAVKNSLDASDEWWERKIKENGDYGKFRNKDLTMIWFRYDMLFSDIAATGKRARAPSEVSENEIYVEEEVGDKGESNQNEVEQVEVGDGDDFEDIGVADYSTNSGTKETSSAFNEIVFPSLDISKRKFCGEKDKGKKKVSGAAALKEDIHSLLQFMATNRNLTCSTPSTEITITVAIEMLRNVPGIAPRSDLWNYACNLLSKKDMREVFASQPCHESRLSWLEFNYNQFRKSS